MSVHTDRGAYRSLHSRPRRRGRLLGTLAALALALCLLSSATTTPAQATPASAWWHVLSSARPANLAPGGEGVIVVQATNIGDGPSSGPTVLSDVLPSGVTVVEKEGIPQVAYYSVFFGVGLNLGPSGPFAAEGLCTTSASTVACSTENAAHIEEIPSLNPFENVELQITVKVAAGVTAGDNKASVVGGGAPSVSIKRPLQITSAPTRFGAEDFSFVPEEEGGAVDARAGSHPFQLTTTFSLNQTVDPLRPPALPRNLAFKLPSGFLGNATAMPRCSNADFVSSFVGGGDANRCPENTVIGVASITIDEPITLGLTVLPVPLYNLAPGPGEPARFGFTYAHAPITLDTSVRTGSDYGVTVRVNNITQLLTVLSTSLTIWGVPGDPSHDSARGWGCLIGGKLGESIPCTLSTETGPPPFLTMPTSCTLPFNASAEGEAWPSQADPGGASFTARQYALKDEFERPLSITGCNQLQFDPTLELSPDVQSASTPTGLTMHVRVPQEVNENPLGLASSSVKDITVTLPEGVSVSPAAADGLQACSEAQIGYTEPTELNPEHEPGAKTPQFTPTQPSCPDASKLGTVEIASPLLPATQHLKGSVYLATPAPNEEAAKNPFNSLIAMYIVAEDPVSGVLVKLPGKATLDQSTGRLTASFKNSPQLPFEDAELHFFGGSRAPLATPARCGAYTSDASFAPWSAMPSEEALFISSASSTFDVNSGPGGSPCPGPVLPFAPSLAAGTTNINAAAFSTLNTTISRADGNQDIQTVQLHMPPGLSGILAGVPLCPEAQANAGTCAQQSRIGTTIVSVGLGNEPFSVTGGEVFLTEKYAGAPFGLSIVNPAVAGPFDLGKVIVRASIQVDPTTAALTITTGQIPHILKGIPLQIKHVNVTIDRPGFTFNPTNCNPMSITGTIGSVEGGSSPVSVPFQATNCAVLKFEPKVVVSTAAKSSKANGASLFFKISYPKGAQGSESWVSEAKFDIPKQLPVRLTTIQKACLSSVFDANPAACPPGSLIGHAVVHTQVLPVPLEGPVYFVSHGGAKFPDAVLVLQGDGVTIDLTGETFINGKTGVTSATFANTPDVPFENIEVTVPTGPASEFAANLPASAKGSFCGQKLVMPTRFKAQNGLEIHQNTNIGVTGCPKAKKATRAQKLTAAMKACRKKHNKAKRAACQRQAHRRYGPLKKKKK